MCRNNSKFYVSSLNAFSFPVNSISIAEKKKYKTFNLDFWIVATDAVKIWDHLNENCQVDYKIISIFLKHCTNN